MKHFGTVAQRFAEARCTDRNHHEFLHVDVVVGVLAAVDDVHHRHRQGHRRSAAEIAIQRQAGLLGGSARTRHRHRQQRIGAEARLVLGTVELDHGLVDEGLIFDIQADDRFADFGVDVLDRFQYAFAEITRLVAVAQFNRLTAAGGGARWHGRTAQHARLQQHVGFNSGIAAGIQNFPGDDINNCAQFVFLKFIVLP